MPTTTHLICPKCQAAMRSYERNRILVDQCQECRGVFLDRGELERLLDVESGPRRNDRDTDPREERHRKRHHDDRHRERRRRSFLEDLLGD